MKKTGLLALCGLFLLGGCSSFSGGSTPRFVGVYDHLREAKNELWYEVDTSESFVDKDDSVTAILVVNDGKIKPYSIPSEITIGELSRLSDQEILSRLPEWHQQDLTESLEKAEKELASYEAATNHPESVSEDDGDDSQEEITTLKEKVKAIRSHLDREPLSVAVQVAIETDNTGNETISSSLTYLDPNYWVEVTAPKLEAGLAKGKLNKVVDFNTFPAAIIYDSTYHGIAKQYDSGLDEFLLTRTKVNLKFDSPETKGVIVE